MKTIVCIGTGPSLSLSQIDAVREKGFSLFGCNLVYRLVSDLELLYGCNYEFWEYYWSRGLRDYSAEKWTTNHEAAQVFGLNWIAERNAPGLSLDAGVIHHGHGSGYSLVSMAWRERPDRIVLLGYDCKYAPDYDAHSGFPGSTPRHFFEGGEYPASMQHWPSVQVKNGVHVELVDLYRSIAAQNLPCEFINCTPDSAIDCFPRMDISEVLE